MELTADHVMVRQMAEDHFDRMKDAYRDGAPLSQLMDCDLYLRELQKDAILDRTDVELFSTFTYWHRQNSKTLLFMAELEINEFFKIATH